VDKGIAPDGKESEEGFDFARVSNVLDGNPEMEAKKPVKKKKKKRGKRKDKSDAYPFLARQFG
jgi:exosome complex exonuclease RRP6